MQVLEPLVVNVNLHGFLQVDHISIHINASQSFEQGINFKSIIEIAQYLVTHAYIDDKTFRNSICNC